MKKMVFTFVTCLILIIQGCSDDNAHQNFSPKNSGFSVAFPQAPQEMSYPDVVTATNIKSFFVEVEKIAYFVNLRTMNREFLKNNIENQIFDSLKILGGNTNKAGIIYENDFKLQGKLAKDIIYLSQDGGQQRVQWVLHKGRLYSLVVSAHGVDLKSDKQALNFLNSFRLIDFNEK